MAAAQEETEAVQQEASERLDQLASELQLESRKRAEAEARAQGPLRASCVASALAQVAASASRSDSRWVHTSCRLLFKNPIEASRRDGTHKPIGEQWVLSSMYKGLKKVMQLMVNAEQKLALLLVR